MRTVVHSSLLLWAILGCLSGFAYASEVVETDKSDSLVGTSASGTVGDDGQGSSNSVPEAPGTTKQAHSSGQAGITFPGNAAAGAGSLASVKSVEATDNSSESVKSAEPSETEPESVTAVSQAGASSGGAEGANNFLVPTTPVSPPDGANPGPSGESLSSLRESVLSSESDASARTSVNVDSDDGFSLSGSDSTPSSRTSWTLSSGDEERKEDDRVSLLSFLLEGGESSEESDSATRESAAEPESSGTMKAEDVLEALGTPKKEGFLKKVKRRFRRSSEKCKWDVSTKILNRSQAISQLGAAPTELRQVTRTLAVPLRKAKPVAPFDTQCSPDMMLVATFLQSSLRHPATDSTAQALPGSEESILSFRSVTQGTTLPVLVTRLLSTEPRIYEVLLGGAVYSLVTVPLYENFEELKSAVIAERRRIRSYLRAAHAFRLSSGEELSRGYRWNLLLDLLILPKGKKASIAFADGVALANYFVLKQKAAMTLKDFVRLATASEVSKPELVYVARASVSLQVLRLMSTYASLKLVFPTLSVSDFEISDQGTLYLSTVSPWYRGGRYYSLIDARRGFYAKIDKHAVKGTSRVETVYVDEKMNTPNIVEIILAIWCGEEDEGEAIAAAASEDRFRTASELMHRRQEQKCLPDSFSVLLSKLLLQDGDFRLPLSQAMESAEWKQVQVTLEIAMQFYQHTKAS